MKKVIKKCFGIFESNEIIQLGDIIVADSRDDVKKLLSVKVEEIHHSVFIKNKTCGSNDSSDHVWLLVKIRKGKDIIHFFKSPKLD